MIIMLHPCHVRHSFLTLYQSHTVPPTTTGPWCLLMVDSSLLALHWTISLVFWDLSYPSMLMIVNDSEEACRCRTVAILCSRFIIACRVNAVTPIMNWPLDGFLYRCIMYQLMNKAKNSVFPDPWDALAWVFSSRVVWFYHWHLPVDPKQFEDASWWSVQRYPFVMVTFWNHLEVVKLLHVHLKTWHHHPPIMNQPMCWDR